MFRTTVEVEVEVEEDNWVLQMLSGGALFLLLHYNVVQVHITTGTRCTTTTYMYVLHVHVLRTYYVHVYYVLRTTCSSLQV